MSLTMCGILLWPLTLPCPSSLTLPSCQHHLPQGMASFPFPLSGFPQDQLSAQGPAPVASVADSTLRAIYSGKPPTCSLHGHGPREVTVEERGKAEKGGQLAEPTPPSGNRDLPLAPSQAPFPSLCSHPDQVFRVLASVSLGIGMNIPLQALPEPQGSGLLCPPVPSMPASCSFLISAPEAQAVFSSFLFLCWTQ